MRNYILQILPDGSIIDWGRNIRSDGSFHYDKCAYLYTGEQAEIMLLILEYTTKIRKIDK